MAMDFPSSPVNGEKTSDGRYVFDSSVGPNGAWRVSGLGVQVNDRFVALENKVASSPNYIINGAFEINQRNFTSTTSGGYFFDRWFVGGNSFTHSAQTFAPGIYSSLGWEAKNYVRFATSGQSGDYGYTQFRTLLEDVRTLAGKTVTVSFWAKAATGNPYISFEWQQSFGSGGSPSGTELIYASKVQLNGGSNWTRYSATVTVPSISGKTIGTTDNGYLCLAFWLSAGVGFNSRAGSIGIQNNTIDMWGIQLEEGSVATPFRRNANSIQGELAACQRYYWRVAGVSSNDVLGLGRAVGNNQARIIINHPVTMRRKPDTSLPYSGNFTVNGVWHSYMVIDSITSQVANIAVVTSDPYLSTGDAAILYDRTGGSFIEFVAEL